MLADLHLHSAKSAKNKQKISIQVNPPSTIHSHQNQSRISNGSKCTAKPMLTVQEGYRPGTKPENFMGGTSKKNIWFFRIFLLKNFYFCYFLNRKLPINKKKVSI
jgi:hypothetical protein